MKLYVRSLRVYYRKQIKDANAIGAKAIIEVIEKDEKRQACVKATNFCFVPPHPSSKTACGCCVHGKTHYGTVYDDECPHILILYPGPVG